jgi:integrase
MSCKGSQAMSRSPVGRVLERTQGEESRQRARGPPSRGKKSACLASGRLRGAARTGTLPEFWTPELSLILGMSTAAPNRARICSVVTTSPGLRPSIPAIPEPIQTPGISPRSIKGAGVEPTPERPVIGVEAVTALADAVPERYRTLILLATFGSLRWGELMGLRKSDIDLKEATVSIERSVVEIGRELVVKEPKTAAGVRTIALPRSLMPEIARHLDRFAEAGPEGRVSLVRTG